MSEHILSSEELEELIKIGFRFKYNIEPSFVDIAIETTTTGYGLNEKEEPCVTVSVQFSLPISTSPQLITPN